MTPFCLAVRQHAPNLGCIRIACDDCVAESSFPTGRFLRKYVPCERMTTFHFTGCRQLEALRRASMGF